jgi:hypothetical protein
VKLCNVNDVACGIGKRSFVGLQERKEKLGNASRMRKKLDELYVSPQVKLR